MDPVVTPHFAFPFRMGVRSVLVSEQGSQQDVMDQAELLLNYEIGDRPGIPEFGIEDQALRQGGADLSHLQSQIEQWVPGAKALLSHGDISGLVDDVTVVIETTTR